MQMKAGTGHISRRFCRIQSCQNVPELTYMLGLNAPLAASLEKPSQPLVPETLDHAALLM